MSYYQCKHRLLDSTNGIALKPNQYLKTDEVSWVRRFGSSIVQVDSIPAGSTVKVIEGTHEHSDFLASQKVEEPEISEAQDSSFDEKPKAKRQRRSRAKVVEASKEK